MVCFLKFLDFILSLSALVNFVHVLETVQPFVDGVTTPTIRRKESSVTCLRNSLAVGLVEPVNLEMSGVT